MKSYNKCLENQTKKFYNIGPSELHRVEGRRPRPHRLRRRHLYGDCRIRSRHLLLLHSQPPLQVRNRFHRLKLVQFKEQKKYFFAFLNNPSLE
jgi:hypothetical protein